MVLSAALTMAANLLLRAGIDGAGGFAAGSPAEAIAALVRLFAQLRFVAGFALYFLASVVWFRVVATEPLSVAYPILVSCTFVLVTAGAVILFGEPLGAAAGARPGRDPRGHRAGVVQRGVGGMIRIGVIGYGYWGPNLVRNFIELRDAEVAAVADLDRSKLETVQRRFPAVAVTTDFQRGAERSVDRRRSPSRRPSAPTSSSAWRR